ncbi:MAG: hypothetical protein DMD52_06430 [Gemmatimonadetes bacterium]|nr:MAG: hypothetical protein DMD52_06430 [Gemmatimonadota bacterium]
MRKFLYGLYGALTVGLTACTDPLVVDNSNNPDRGRVFSNAADLEQLISNTYARTHAATIGGGTVLTGGINDALQPQLLVMGMENVSTLANFAMGPRGAIPRNPITNAPGSQGNLGNYRDWVVGHSAARMAALGIARLQALTLGSPARDARARAFARFSQGVALGNLALAYDSASILTENDNPEADAGVIVPLSGYRQVMGAALAYLDSAIAIASGPSPAGPSGDWFPLPSAWVNGNALTAGATGTFVQLARSYKARFRAGMARTPAERADITAGGIVDWSKVIADAAAGIQSDFAITMDRTIGWDIAWVAQHYATGSANWHQASQFFLGMADTSGGYDSWLAMAPLLRSPFTVVTPDRRFPQGTTRPPQNAVTVPGTFAATPYFRNRPAAADVPGDPLGISQYDFFRSRAFRAADRVGPYPVMTMMEIKLLQAEGYLRSNPPQIVLADSLIDISRVGKGQMKPLKGVITDTLMPVPGMDAAYVAGSRSCVPRVPDAASPGRPYTKTKCGNLWDALKWEYRLETAYTGYGMWFFAARGWGDLPIGTATDWPVPNPEMAARSEPFYGTGGTGGRDAAGPGNYGLFLGGVYGW